MNQPEKFAVLDAIAAALGGTISRRAEPSLSSYDPPAWQIVELPECGISLHYHGDRKGDYLHVSGEWPKDAAGAIVTGRDAEWGSANPSINVSAAKRPEVAAADIRRRLLPELSRLYAKALDVCAGRNAYALAVTRNNEALAQSCGAEYRKNTYNSGASLHGLPEGARVAHVSDKSVRLELECTIGEACAILAARAAAAAREAA